MTFHVGNGITLTQEEENLPDEQREEIIRQKRQAQATEKELDKARTYFDAKDDDEPISGETAQSAVDLVNRHSNEDAQSAIDPVNRIDVENAQDAARESAAKSAANGSESSGAFGLAEGSFGVRRNEDFTEYRKQRDAAHKAVREARSARSAAEREQRTKLLASGRYFDDGRGNIRLKAQERQYMAGDRRHRHLRTAADDGSGMASIRAAGDAAWDTAIQQQRADQVAGAERYTQSAIRTNREAAAMRQQAQAEQQVNGAKAKLSVFDGFAAALDALRADASNAEDNIVSVWGGKDENGRDARWNYDSDGRILGQADARDVKDGKRLASGGVQKESDGFRKGFVDPTVLKAINAQLNRRGANYALTGIMARQKYGALNKPIDGTEPMFYVQGVRNDGSQFGQYMTMKDVYRWGVENFRSANGKNGEADGMAEEFAINALGGYDPDGYRKTQKEHPSVTVAKINAEARQAEVAGRKEVAGLNNETKLKVADIQKALKERGLDISEDKVAELIRHNKATEWLAGAKQSAASAPTFNKAIYERLSAKEDRLLMKDPKTRTEEENEELKRIQAKLRAMEGDDPVEKKPTPAQSVLFGGDTQGGTTAPGAKNPPVVKTPAHAKATNGANADEPKTGTAQSGDGEVKNPVPDTTKQPQQGGKKTSLTPAEKSVGRDAVAMFKKIHPDITDVDDNPGKYDKQLTSIAQSLSGDYKFKSNYAIQKENDERTAIEKEQADANAKLEKYFTDKDKAAVQKAKELYAPLYERAKRLAMEDNGGDYGKSVRKKFAELVKEYNKQNGLKFEDFFNQEKQVFGDYHVADLLSDVFGDDAGIYLGPAGNRGQAQRRLSSHGKDK